MRPVTPVCLQGKKRHYDLLQKTVPITNGEVPEVELNRPEADPENQVILVADKLRMKER